MPTRRGVCPLSFAVQPPKAITAPDGAQSQDVLLTTCIGPQCHLWNFQPGTEPQDGDCAFNITAQGSAHTAHLMHAMFNSAAAQQAQAEPERGN